MFGKPKTPTITEQDVLAALRGVKDPDLHRDLVDLGMIKNIAVDGNRIALTVNLTTPACPLKAEIERDVRGALVRRFGDQVRFDVTMSAEVRGKPVQDKGDIPGVKNVIAVGSGKGGVGKSTMAAAIAYGLQSHGAAVGLLDADVYGPSIPHLTSALGRPMVIGNRIAPLEAHGLKVISIGNLVDPKQAMIMRGPMLHNIIQQFLREVSWGTLDYLVIDLPPGTGDVPLSLSQNLPLTGAVVVCTPQEVALLDAVRAVTMFRQLKVPLLGMIENMSFFDVVAYLKERGSTTVRTMLGDRSYLETPGDERVHLFGSGGARRKAEELEIPFLGEVPLNILLRQRGDEGNIRAALDPGSPARPYLLGVVEQLAAQISIHNLKAPKLPKLEILN
jgi:ATP-binding protein involved in chromosome partitioning